MTTNINLPENQRFGYVYMTKNLINGKMYIGIHKGDSLDINYAGSGVALHRAFKVYGRDNFVNGILAYAKSADELTKLEQLYIEYYNTYDNGYNMTLGGESFLTKDVIIRRSKTKTNSYSVYTKEGDFVLVADGMKKVAELIGSTKGAVKNSIKRGNLVNGYQVVKVEGKVEDKIGAVLSHKDKVVQYNKNRDFSHSEETKKRIKATLKAKGHKPSKEHMAKLHQLRLKKVNQFTKDGVFIASYPSIKDAYTKTATNRQSLNDCLNGRNKSAGGYKWEYAS
jgi:hypothetical protein